MSTAIPAAAPEPVSTGGAWLGFGIAVRAAMTVAGGVAGMAMTAAIPVGVDFFERAIARRRGSVELPPEFGRLVDVVLEIGTILGPYARITGISAIAIGLALFAASAALVSGSETGRRASRALLLADVAHTAASTAWIVVLGFTKLGAWSERYQAALEDLMEAVPNRGARMPPTFQMSGAMMGTSSVVSGLVSLAIAGALVWLAGHRVARDWCAARSGRSAVASPEPQR